MPNATTEPGTGPAPGSRLTRGATLAVVVIEALLMLLAGQAKFTHPEVWVKVFEGFGYPVALVPVVGGLEVAGALLLFIPRFTSWAALGLGVIMVGALGSVLIHHSPLGWKAPVIHLILLAISGFSRWPRRMGAGARVQ